MRFVLGQQYGPDGILYFEPNNPNGPAEEKAESFLADELTRRRIELITGHHEFGLHRYLGMRCRYFSMLREPIDRIVSNYYYALQFDGHTYASDIKSGKLSLEEYVGNPEISCPFDQARMLAGSGPADGGVSVQALENIRSNVIVTGTTDQFDASLLLIAKALQWRPPLYVRRNVTKSHNSFKRKELVFKLRERFQELYKQDYDVYNYVNQEIKKQIRGEGLLPRALAAFWEIQQDVSQKDRGSIFSQYNFEHAENISQCYVGSAAYQEIESYLSGECGSAASAQAP